MLPGFCYPKNYLQSIPLGFVLKTGATISEASIVTTQPFKLSRLAVLHLCDACLHGFQLDLLSFQVDTISVDTNGNTSIDGQEIFIAISA